MTIADNLLLEAFTMSSQALQDLCETCRDLGRDDLAAIVRNAGQEISRGIGRIVTSRPQERVS